MIFLKYKSDFVGSIKRPTNINAQFGVNTSNIISNTVGQASLGNLNVDQSWEQLAFDFISVKEGFLEKAKNDEGTLRAGYGTDKIVLANGEIKTVGSDTVFTREDGKRTLIYQIKTTFAPRVITQIGKNRWDALNDKQKAALVSFTYNVGSLTNPVVSAITSGAAATAVANAICYSGIYGENTGINSLNEFNFDMLKALVEEMNRYNETPTDALAMLNAKPEFDIGWMYITVLKSLGLATVTTRQPQ